MLCARNEDREHVPVWAKRSRTADRRGPQTGGRSRSSRSETGEKGPVVNQSPFPGLGHCAWPSVPGTARRRRREP